MTQNLRVERRRNPLFRWLNAGKCWPPGVKCSIWIKSVDSTCNQLAPFYLHCQRLCSKFVNKSPLAFKTRKTLFKHDSVKSPVFCTKSGHFKDNFFCNIYYSKNECFIPSLLLILDELILRNLLFQTPRAEDEWWDTTSDFSLFVKNGSGIWLNELSRIALSWELILRQTIHTMGAKPFASSFYERVFLPLHVARTEVQNFTLMSAQMSKRQEYFFGSLIHLHDSRTL